MSNDTASAFRVALRWYMLSHAQILQRSFPKFPFIVEGAGNNKYKETCSFVPVAPQRTRIEHTKRGALWE